MNTQQVETEATETLEAFKDDIEGISEAINNILGSSHLKRYPQLSNALDNLQSAIDDMDNWEEEEEE